MTVFEALYTKTPVMVMPFQPEQAHNGVCLERMGCGKRMIPPQPFRGDPGIYCKALEQMTDDEIIQKIDELVDNPQTYRNLKAAKNIIERYNGVGTLSSMLLQEA